MRALRARQWVHLLPLPWVILVADAGPTTWQGIGRLCLATFVAGLLLAYAYGLNAIGDRASDEDPEKNPLIGLESIPPGIWIPILSTGVLAIALAGMLSIVALAAAVTSVVAGTLYSWGVRARAIPIVSTLTDTVIFVPLMYLSVVEWETARRILPLALLFTLLLTQNQLLHEIADSEEDAKGGYFTTAVWLGRRTTAWVAGALAPLGALLMALLDPSPMAIVGSGGLLVGAVLAMRAVAGDAAWARRTHRWVGVATGAVVFFIRLIESH